MKVILIGINFVSSHGLKPSDYGPYNAPSFGQVSNDQVPVVPHASNPNDAWNNFEEQQYQQQVSRMNWRDIKKNYFPKDDYLTN